MLSEILIQTYSYDYERKCFAYPSVLVYRCAFQLKLNNVPDTGHYHEKNKKAKHSAKTNCKPERRVITFSSSSLSMRTSAHRRAALKIKRGQNSVGKICTLNGMTFLLKNAMISMGSTLLFRLNIF